MSRCYCHILFMGSIWTEMMWSLLFVTMSELKISRKWYYWKCKVIQMRHGKQPACDLGLHHFSIRVQPTYRPCSLLDCEPWPPTVGRVGVWVLLGVSLSLLATRVVVVWLIDSWFQVASRRWFWRIWGQPLGTCGICGSHQLGTRIPNIT